VPWNALVAKISEVTISPLTSTNTKKKIKKRDKRFDCIVLFAKINCMVLQYMSYFSLSKTNEK
jgi:hypothetical protein